LKGDVADGFFGHNLGEVEVGEDSLRDDRRPSLEQFLNYLAMTRAISKTLLE